MNDPQLAKINEARQIAGFPPVSREDADAVLADLPEGADAESILAALGTEPPKPPKAKKAATAE